MNIEAELYRAFDSDPAPIVEFLQWLVHAYQLPGKPHMLDVGCGPGRLFKPLAQLGWHITAYEPNDAYYARALEEARHTQSVLVEQAGFNDISATDAYDLVCGINSSFAHVLTPALREDAFERAFRALHPGGLLFLDLPNLLRILKEYAGPGEQTASMAGRPVRLIRRHEIDYNRAVFTTHEEYTYTDEQGKERTFHKEHPYAVASFPELSYLLGTAGFDRIKTYASYSARAEQAVGSGRMMIVATKGKDA